MPMIDIDNLHLELIRHILSEIVPGCRVWAFGSRVSGKAQKYSDLDLVIVSENKTDWRIIERLKDAFSESDLPIIIDVVDFFSVSENFKKIIDGNHVVIQ